MRIFPRNIDFFKLFERQTDILEQVSKIFSELEKGSNLQKQMAWIQNLEHKGDDINHEIITTLNQTFITPIDREDITRLTNRLEDIVDGVDRFVNRMGIYKIDPIPKKIYKYGRLVKKSILEVVLAVRLLKDNHKSRDQVFKHLEAVRRYEHDVDELHRKNIGDLLENEKDAIRLIKLKEIYESLEEISDSCQLVARGIEMIVIKI